MTERQHQIVVLSVASSNTQLQVVFFMSLYWNYQVSNCGVVIHPPQKFNDIFPQVVRILMHLQHDLFCKFRLTCDFSEQVDYKQTMSWLVWVSPHLHSWKGQLELFMFCSVLLREMYLLRRLMRWLKWDVNKYHLLMHWVLGNSLTIDCKEAVFEVVFLFWILILTIKKLNY